MNEALLSRRESLESSPWVFGPRIESRDQRSSHVQCAETHRIQSILSRTASFPRKPSSRTTPPVGPIANVLPLHLLIFEVVREPQTQGGFYYGTRRNIATKRNQPATRLLHRVGWRGKSVCAQMHGKAACTGRGPGQDIMQFTPHELHQGTAHTLKAPPLPLTPSSNGISTGGNGCSSSSLLPYLT